MFYPFLLFYFLFTIVGSVGSIVFALTDNEISSETLGFKILFILGFLLFWNLFVSGFYSIVWFALFRRIPIRLSIENDEISIEYPLRFLSKKFNREESSVKLETSLGSQVLVIKPNKKMFEYRFYTQFMDMV